MLVALSVFYVLPNPAQQHDDQDNRANGQTGPLDSVELENGQPCKRCRENNYTAQDHDNG